MALTPATVQLREKQFDPKWRECHLWKTINGITLRNCLDYSGDIGKGEPLKKVENKGPLINFGKFKGRPIAELIGAEDQYLEWASQNVHGFSSLLAEAKRFKR